jgi:transcriptional regulator with XRE-family HTH domain
MLYFGMTSIGYQISQRRRERGLTQSELAKRSGLPQPNLSNIEKGRQDLTVSTLIRIAHSLGFSPASFFNEEKSLGSPLTRKCVEQLAGLVWSVDKVVPEEDRWVVDRLRMLLPGALNRRVGRMAVERAWLELRNRYMPAEVKLLVQRCQDERQRRGLGL